MITAAHRDRVEGYIASGRRRGWHRRRRWRAPRPRPRLLRGADAHRRLQAGMKVVQEEIFGPVVVVVPVRRRGRGDRHRQRHRVRPVRLRVLDDTARAYDVATPTSQRQRRHQHRAAQPRSAVRRVQDERRRPRRRQRSASTPTASCSRSSGPAERQPQKGSTVKGIVFDEGGLEVARRRSRCASVAARTRCGCAIASRRPVPQRRVASSTARSRSRRRWCWATRAPASSTRSAPPSRKVQVGDHVVLTTLGNCGAVRGVRPRPAHALPRHDRQAAPRRSPSAASKAFQFANAGVFTEHTVVKRDARPSSIDQRRAARGRVPHRLRGDHRRRARCSTGPRCSHGQTVVVIGVGGIGLIVIQGAALADRRPIIAIDTNPAKEAVARQFGATHFIDAVAGRRRPSQRSRISVCPTASTTSSSASAIPPSSASAIDLLDWGGTLHAPRRAQARHRGRASSSTRSTTTSRSWAAATASTRPHHDIPLLVDLYQAGRLKLDELVSQLRRSPTSPRPSTTCTHGKLNRGVLDVLDVAHT